MLNWISKLLAPPAFEDEDKTRAAGLLNAILLITLLIALVVIPILAVLYPVGSMFDLQIGGVMAAIVLGLQFLMRRGHLRTASVLLSFVLLVMVTITLYLFGGVRNNVVTGYFLVVTLAALLLGGRAAVTFGLLSILAALGVFYAEISGAIVLPVPDEVQLPDWIIVSTVLVMGTLLLRSAVLSIAEGFERTRRNEVALTESNRELQTSRDALQIQTDDLVRRTRYLEATAAVARDAASVLDLQELLLRVANLISERFGFYHAGIFLLDSSSEWAELQAASSEGGQRMLARGHRLRVGEEGIVGYVTGRGEPRVALDVGTDAVFFDNPDLPETRSEMALPLRARGEIIGALDVQSREPEAFSEEDVAVLQTLADQVAMAISNARLFQQAQESMEGERRAYGEITRSTWRELLQAHHKLGYRYSESGVVPLVGQKPDARASVSSQSERGADDTALADAGAKPVQGLPELVLPVKVRGHVIGAINAHKPGEAGEWTVEEVALMETLAEQLALALESARLYQDTQRRALRERLTREIAARMRETLDMDMVLQGAVREIGEKLGIAEVEVRMGSDVVVEG